MSDWGISVNDARAVLYSRYWQNWPKCQRLLNGSVTFPISLGLKPPSDKQASSDAEKLFVWQQDWRNVSGVEWADKRWQRLGSQQVPVKLVFHNLKSLTDFLQVTGELEQWFERVQPLIALAPESADFKAELKKQLAALMQLTTTELTMLQALLPQLQAGMGVGLYLRALPLAGVHGKFIEQHEKLISALLNALHDQAVNKADGLLSWLGCMNKPAGWLTIRPLCEKTRQAFAGLELLQLTGQQLAAYPLPGDTLIVVENLQSGLVVPNIEHAVVVCGTGNHLNWLGADWVKDKKVIYWGDIDSDGLTLLARARAMQPNLVSVMMDVNTFEQFNHRATQGNSCGAVPTDLTEQEALLFERLHQQPNRLEQEMLDADYISQAFFNLQ
ncbi:DUF3322 domain-containing protein [Salinibius halmophilus]|uniref:DUF3322 domain-containing protein n=1 Tax=Salinibius halmophilus TaxID=1853216 RepID=UPI001313EBA2|nr:DUF3322 domain-containing protein [Salinibius halmophilus]